MVSKEQLDIIKNAAQELFAIMEVPGEIQVEGLEDGSTVVVSIHTEEPKIYIGEKGQTLFEIQHILKLIVRKKIEDPIYVSLDINDYKKNKEEYLRDLAKTTADEVTLLKKEKELPPMAPAERKVIHMALADRDDIVSESLGEGPERRVTIKPK